jgi:hypothetical protein
VVEVPGEGLKDEPIYVNVQEGHQRPEPHWRASAVSTWDRYISKTHQEMIGYMKVIVKNIWKLPTYRHAHKMSGCESVGIIFLIKTKTMIYL